MSNLKIYLDKDINSEIIKTKKIAVIGFGSQGYGQSLNLKDSGCDVVLGLRLGGNSDIKAQKNSMRVMSIKDAVAYADIIQILIPDEIQKEVYEKEIAPYLRSGQYLMFSHGFNIHYGYINAPENVNVIMVAPKAPGHAVRSEYIAGRGVPALIAIYKDVSGISKEIALSYASAIGSGRLGILETTFKEETETDLFGEQAVLCGGCSALIKNAFETLVEAGYSPYMAYFEVCHELKLIVDLINQGGLSDMHYSISNNAEYGDLTRGPKLIDSSVKSRMKEVLADIQSGKYADEFMNELNSGAKKFNEARKEIENHLLETTGRELRASFIRKDNKLVDKALN